MRYLTNVATCWLACTAILAQSTLAEDKADKKSPPTIRAELAELVTATLELDRELRDTTQITTPAEREAFVLKSMKAQMKHRAKLANQGLALAQRHVADEAAIDVLNWILTNHGSTDAANEAAQLLITHHLKHPKTQQTAYQFMYSPMSWTEKMFRRLVAADLPPKRKTQALFQLATCMKIKAGMIRTLQTANGTMAEIIQLRFGDAYLSELRMTNPGNTELEAVRLYQQVLRKHADETFGNKTLGEYSKSAIFELQHLSVGKTALEVMGEDIDGQEMKLSDYRGKVVVLAFWGHW